LSVEIRTCTRDEVHDALAPISHFFGRRPDPERTEQHLRVLEPERMHAAWDDGRAVGSAGAFSFRLTVPGARVPAAGITMVAVAPTHRRRGILTAMTRAQLDDVHRRREPLAVLWASEETIYGRFGYGMAVQSGYIELARRHAAFREPVAAVEGRLVDQDEALELVPPIYERVAAESTGMLARSEDWWATRVITSESPPWVRQGEQLCVVLEVDRQPAAYALYCVEPSWTAGSSTGVVDVAEAMGDSSHATAAIWRYLLEVDWLERVQASHLPVDHPLWLLLAEPRRMGFRLEDSLLAAARRRRSRAFRAHVRGFWQRRFRGPRRVLSLERRALEAPGRRGRADDCAGRARSRRGRPGVGVSGGLHVRPARAGRPAGGALGGRCGTCRRALSHRPGAVVPGDFLKRPSHSTDAASGRIR
jgi:predicted acetyltransferase